jgi:hypothetical protein
MARPAIPRAGAACLALLARPHRAYFGAAALT